MKLLPDNLSRKICYKSIPYNFECVIQINTVNMLRCQSEETSDAFALIKTVYYCNVLVGFAYVALFVKPSLWPSDQGLTSTTINTTQPLSVCPACLRPLLDIGILYHPSVTVLDHQDPRIFSNPLNVITPFCLRSTNVSIWLKMSSFPEWFELFSGRMTCLSPFQPCRLYYNIIDFNSHPISEANTKHCSLHWQILYL